MVTENDRVYLSKVEQQYVERLIMSDAVLTAGQWKLVICYLTTAPFTSSAEEWAEIARQDAEDGPSFNATADEVEKRGQLTLPGMTSVTSSPESAGGPTPSALPAGLTTAPCGPAPARASRSPRPASAKVSRMPATSRLFGYGSSPSAVLACSLASRLRLRLARGGSTLYSMNWSDSATPAGRLYCQRAASALRTSGSGCGSWPTPMTGNADNRGGNAGGMSRQKVEMLCAWPTPTVGDSSNSANETATRHVIPPTGVHAGQTLVDATRQIATTTAPWFTPKLPSGGGKLGSRHKLEDQTIGLMTAGPPSSGSPAATGKPGQLNPAFSLWLMGYPAAWGSCGELAMQSCRRSPRRSSKRTRK